MSLYVYTENGLEKAADISKKTSVMTGATSSTDGKSGLVPTPLSSDTNKYLKGDGTWEEIETINPAELLAESKEYTDTKIASLVNEAPETLDTLKEIADVIQSNEAAVDMLNSAIGNKVDKVSGMGLSTNDYSTEEKNKLSAIATGAEVNQNAFSNVTVGSTTIPAGSKTDTLILIAGDNVSMTPDSVNNKITISGTDTHYTTGLKVGASSTAIENTSAMNGNVYLNVLDNTTVRDSHKITGSGSTTVTSDENGNITIESADTKNTSGATDTASKIFLIGATSQEINSITYSHDTAYIGTDGCVYSGGEKTLTSITDEDVINALGYTPGTSNASEITVDDALSSTSMNPVQNKVISNEFDTIRQEYGNLIFIGTREEYHHAATNGTIQNNTLVIITDDSNGEIIPHNYVEEIIKQPTYTETGLKAYSCSCGAYYTEEIPVLTGTTIDSGLAGLYDESGIMIASWDELVNDYGMDVETDYTSSTYNTNTSSPYYILTNNENLSSGTNLILGDNITKIGMYAFKDCLNLTNITILNNVTSIGKFAFDGCANLTSITIPNSVTSIGAWSFANCTSLKTAYVDADIDGVGIFAYSGSEEGFTVTFGRSLRTTPHIFGSKSNGSSNSEYASNVSKIIISSNITSISDYTFTWCASLTSVEIPDSVTSIGNASFQFCENLTSVTIPDSVTSIGISSFSSCENLTSVTIPDSVTSIGGSAFDDVPHIYYNGTATGAPWGALAMN